MVASVRLAPTSADREGQKKTKNENKKTIQHRTNDKPPVRTGTKAVGMPQDVGTVGYFAVGISRHVGTAANLTVPVRRIG